MDIKIDDLIKNAENGDSEAEYSLGNAYYFGNVQGIKIDKKQALEWVVKAAEHGLDKAMFTAGFAYLNWFDITDEKFSKSLYWFLKFIQAKSVKQNYECGTTMDLAKGKDFKDYLFLLETVANEGNPYAQDIIGRLYLNGVTCKIQKDIPLAIQWLTKSAEQGNSNAQLLIGSLYAIGKEISRDENKVIYWLTKAAEQGNSKAQFLLGLELRFNKDYQDFQKSFYWFSCVAALNNPRAMYYLGSMYNEGKGTKKDIELALSWYLKSASLGDKNAQHKLGDLYNDGIDVEKDTNQAIYWYQLSSKNGSYYASKKLAFVFKDLNNFVEEKKYLELAIIQAHPDYDDLGEIYFELAQFYIEYNNAKNRKKNLNKAKELLDLAIKFGYEDAKDLLATVHNELYIGDSSNNKMGLLAKDLIGRNIPISHLNDEVENTLKNKFGEAYYSLQPSTRTGLATSLLTYISFLSIGEEKYKNLDFSSIINPITKSLEIELKFIFFTKFLEYLKQNNIPPTEFNPEKQKFVSEKKNKIPPYEVVEENEINKENANLEEYNYFKQKVFDRSSTIQYVDKSYNGAFSLGGIKNFIGISEVEVELSDVFMISDDSKAIPITKKEIVIDKHFFNYIKCVFKDDAFSSKNHDEEIKKYLLRFTKKVSYIAFELRNPTNHTEIMESWKATHCGNIIFMKDNFLLEFISKIKPEYLYREENEEEEN